MSLNRVCHIEFAATDIARSRRFFEGLFGWTFQQFTDEMVIFGDGEDHIGGLMKAAEVSPGESPSVWIKVSSIDDLLAKTPALGGSVLRAKTELSHVGFSAQVSDPDGNPVGLVEYV
ncbi:MAG: VOC family protein [Fimbriimonadales bacterium]